MVFIYEYMGYMIYMGKDKYENEDLLKYGFKEDVWFHVDNLSSAHVYLRLNKDETIEDIKPKLLEELCQLVKANSIEGCKKDRVRVVYTPFPNIKKTQGMDIGSVSFFDEDQCFYANANKDNSVAKKFKKIEVEKEITFMKEGYEDYCKENNKIEKAKKEKQRQQEIQNKKDTQKQKDLKEYKELFKKENMKTNKDDDDDDFM